MAKGEGATGLLVARIFISAIFLYDGFTKITEWGATTNFMEMIGLPIVPVLLAIVVVVEIVCGLAVLTGIKAQVGALVLFVMLVPITLLFHGFWAVAEMERGFQIIEFLKNLSIMGGLLLVAATTPGPVKTG